MGFFKNLFNSKNSQNGNSTEYEAIENPIQEAINMFNRGDIGNAWKLMHLAAELGYPAGYFYCGLFIGNLIAGERYHFLKSKEDGTYVICILDGDKKTSRWKSPVQASH